MDGLDHYHLVQYPPPPWQAARGTYSIGRNNCLIGDRTIDVHAVDNTSCPHGVGLHTTDLFSNESVFAGTGSRRESDAFCCWLPVREAIFA